MSFRSKLNQRSHKLCHVDDSTAYLKTSNGLSVTPAEIKRLTQNGIPVSSSAASMFCEGVSGSGAFVLPVDERRGVDIADVWNASRDAQQRIVGAHLNDVKLYGE